MYADYQQWARNHGARLLNRIEFGRRMGAFFNVDSKTTPRRIRGSVERCWDLYALDMARQRFDARFEAETDWPDSTGAPPVALPNPFVGGSNP